MLLPLVVVNLSFKEAHPLPMRPKPSYIQLIPDELVEHSRMIRSAWSPIAFFGFRVNAAAAATTTDYFHNIKSTLHIYGTLHYAACYIIKLNIIKTSCYSSHRDIVECVDR